MQELWHRIRAWLRTHAPDVESRVLPGASADELRAAEKAVGHEFPKDVRDSYAACNGFRGGPRLDGLWTLLPLKRITSEWKEMKDLLDRGTFNDEAVRSEGPVADRWWDPGWIPVASDSAGNLICVDTAAPSADRNGQLVLFRHADGLRSVVADGMRQWLDVFARDLEAGKYRIDEDGGLAKAQQ